MSGAMITVGGGGLPPIAEAGEKPATNQPLY